MSGNGFHFLYEGLWRGDAHTTASLSYLAQHAVVWTGGSLTTLLVHEWQERHAACEGLHCWHCARGCQPITVGFASGLRLKPRRPGRAPIHLVVGLFGETICEQVLRLAEQLDTLRGSACYVRSAQRVDPWHHERAEEDPLPAGLDPLLVLLPLYGRYARYGLWGPSLRVEIPEEHLPQPKPLLPLSYHCRGEG